MNDLMPCPICLSKTDVCIGYSRHAAGEWPSCRNCEATAPPAVWAELVKVRAEFDARGDGGDTVTDNTTRFL
jgi:hypothetical protein